MIIKTLAASLLGLKLAVIPYQFPENRLYRPNVDTGFVKYETLSIQGTNTYALTFDDGPHRTNTPQILDLLKKYNIKATFFIVTSRLNNSTFPIFKRILDEGHIAASHHHEHDNSNQQTQADYRAKLKKSILKLASYYKRAGYDYNKIYYRFPYAAYGENDNYHHMNVLKDVSNELFGDNCINFVFWDADSGDWIPTLSSRDVFNNIKSFQIGGEYTTYYISRANGHRRILKKKIINERPTRGGVVLMHDIQKRTIGALELFADYASKNDINFTSIDVLDEFSFKNKKCNLIGDTK